MGFYLLDAATGQILEHISAAGSFLFAQPVFAGNDLLLAGRNGIGLTADEITTPGAPIATVSPNAAPQGIQTKITLTGSGFVSGAKVFVSGTQVGGSRHLRSVVHPTLLQLDPISFGNVGRQRHHRGRTRFVPVRGEHVHGVSEHHSLTSFGRIREASVYAQHQHRRFSSAGRTARNPLDLLSFSASRSPASRGIA
jgi:hypothetical protein